MIQNALIFNNNKDDDRLELFKKPVVENDNEDDGDGENSNKNS